MKESEKDRINMVTPVITVFGNKDIIANKCQNQFHVGDEGYDEPIRMTIKNIGVGPALDVKLKINDKYILNDKNQRSFFDIGVNEEKYVANGYFMKIHLYGFETVKRNVKEIN